MSTRTTSKNSSQNVESFLAALDHPMKCEIEALRQWILGVAPGISEEIKWNAPSFRTSEHFATMHLRAKDQVQLVLHFGAKKRDLSAPAIEDPSRLLEWRGTDRALVTFSSLADIENKQHHLQGILQQWLRHV